MVTAQILLFLTNLIFSVIEFLIGLRILLRLLGASSAAPFAAWVYDTTDQIISPFLGMFPSPKLSGGLTIEISALFAFLVYAFIAYLIAELIAFLEAQRTGYDSYKKRR